MDRLCNDETARLDPAAYQIQLRDFLDPTADSNPEDQAPPNKLYRDTFKAVDRFNARAALVPVGWKIKSEKQRWLLGLIQLSLVNAYVLFKNNEVMAGKHQDSVITMHEFVEQVGQEVYAGRV